MPSPLGPSLKAPGGGGGTGARLSHSIRWEGGKFFKIKCKGKYKYTAKYKLFKILSNFAKEYGEKCQISVNAAGLCKNTKEDLFVIIFYLR